MTPAERITILNENKPPIYARHVLYWMQSAVRISYNFSLAYAINTANSAQLPLVVYFEFDPQFPGVNKRNFAFLLDGVKDVRHSLKKLGIPFATGIKSMKNKSLYDNLANHAYTIITDKPYLKYQIKDHKTRAEKVICPFIEIESNTTVPIQTASEKEEWGAYTIRPKITKLLPHYLKPFILPKLKIAQGITNINLIPPDNDGLLDEISKSISPKLTDPAPVLAKGGENEAKKALALFIREKLEHYADKRNEPFGNFQSGLSPYLHFGHISPIEITLKVKETNYQKSIEAYLEQLIIRRELAINFVQYNPQYDNYECLPNWIKKTLSDHLADPRPVCYSLERLENSSTEDPLWNYCQKELTQKGKLNGYLRMYWGKKVIGWLKDPKEAYSYLVYLNDKYEIDGRDPNGYAGIAWCFGKHDRPFFRRPIYGLVRYMSGVKIQKSMHEIVIK